MPATSRWVYFDPNTDTSLIADSYNTISGTGTLGYVEGSNTVSGLVTITPGVSDQLQVSINGGSYQNITLTSGTNLDARTVARDIEYKIKQLSGNEYDHVTTEYINNKFRITSSKLGSGSTVAVQNGINNCLHLLGMASSISGPVTVVSVPGTSGTNNAAYTGQVTTGGVYGGQFSDIYTVMIGTQHPVGSGSLISGSYAGSITTAGDWNESTSDTYTIHIDTTNGAVMNAGSNNVPTFTVTSTNGDNIASPTELLYSDYFYNIGSKGVRAKFSDYPMSSGTKFSIACSTIQYAAGSTIASGVGSAQYVWSSLLDGKSTSATTTQVVGTAVGNRGVTIAFSNSGLLTARDTFRIICSGPQPTTIGTTILNFGSVTVSTYSPTKVVWFELVSGATVMSSCKFGLNSHGSSQHHNAGNTDTKFAFGTAGAGQPAVSGTQWKKNILGNIDLASDIPPSYLYATEDNLSVVNTADDSEVVGIAPGQMVSDFIYLAIKLGALESGPNSTIIYRMFFDFS